MGYSRNFWALTLSVFLFMTSFNLIIPELNGFITQLGGEGYKGLIIGLFTLTAAISRPFSGKMADTVGRKSTMYIGTIVSIVVTLFYPLSGTVVFFLTLRFLHGFSTGFLPTGATALITDILPAHKRGQGMGVYGTGIALGTGVGQMAGSPIANTFSLNGLFITSSCLALVSVLVITSIKETLPERRPFSFDIIKIKIDDVIEKTIIPPAIVMLLTTFCTGLVLVLSPDMSEFLGIENKGWYFVFYSVFTIIIRLLAGKLSDKIGRREALIAGISILIAAMLLTGYAKSILWYTIASSIFGIATGIISPAIFAWMADLVPPKRRGAGSATIFIALEVGILLGSMSTVGLYQSNVETLEISFLVGALSAGIALVYVIGHLLNGRRRSKSNA